MKNHKFVKSKYINLSKNGKKQLVKKSKVEIKILLQTSVNSIKIDWDSTEKAEMSYFHCSLSKSEWEWEWEKSIKRRKKTWGEIRQWKTH